MSLGDALHSFISGRRGRNLNTFSFYSRECFFAAWEHKTPREHLGNFKKQEPKKQESEVRSLQVWERGAVPAHSASILPSVRSHRPWDSLFCPQQTQFAPGVKNLFLRVCSGAYAGSHGGTIRSVRSEPVSATASENGLFLSVTTISLHLPHPLPVSILLTSHCLHRKTGSTTSLILILLIFIRHVVNLSKACQT